MDKTALISELVKAALVSRDLCGSESEAMEAVLSDNGVAKDQWEKLKADAWQQVNIEWRNGQRAAGVPSKYRR